MSPSLPRQMSGSGLAGPDRLDSGFGASHESSTTHPLSSPCFIHSRLDSVLESNRKEHSYFDSHNQSAASSSTKHDNIVASSADSHNANQPTASNLRNVFSKNRPEPRHRGAQGAVEPESGSEGEEGSDASTSRNGSSASFSHSSGEDSEEDSDRVRSLTRQLAETAVGVREMSKQLGRARVKSTIQSVLIITKARDNHLIKLTRELAIWLMNTPRNGKDTGLIVYVDAQLRQSKRFDAEGIRQEYPHLFAPGSSRQQSFGADVDDDRPSSEPSSLASSRAGSISHSREESQLRYWTSDMCSRSPHLFDFVVTLGGDGTVLFCSWLFQRIVPPVMPFALGSLGFLTNFDYSDYKKVLKSALDTGIRVNLRMRFTATVYRATLPSSTSADRRKRRAIRSGKTGEIIMRNIQEGGWDRIETPLPSHGDLRGAFTESADTNDAEEDRSAPSDDPRVASEGPEPCDGLGKKDKEVMCFSTRPVETFEVLNDLVVDRGPSPYVSLLEVFGDEHHMTTAQADGLCISTPTGSTAYSLSAGGSLVHPEIPAILITPICPHTLSFRPMLLPDSMELRIAVPYNSRSTAWASFDGRGRVELKQGDHIKVTASRYPFPTVCAENQSTDWFESISRTLKWNERQRQKSFVVVEEGDEVQEEDETKAKGSASSKAQASSKQTSRKAQVSFAKKGSDREDEDEVEEDEEQEEEEAFDIDDTSTAATRASSPDGVKDRQSSQHHHHHHHHHRRDSSNKPRSRNGSSTGSLASSLTGSNSFLQALHPLTSVRGQGGAARDELKGVHAGSQGLERETSQSEVHKVDPNSTNAKRDDEASRLKSYQHGVVQPSTRSLLDSPDRFGLAGPPQPPRAISERHLASADFRLDGGKADDNGETEKASQQADQKKAESDDNDEKRGDRIQLSSLTNSKKENNAAREEIQAPLLEPGGPSKKASKLYKKLRAKAKSDRSNSQDSRGGGGDTLDLTKSSSRGTGTALVVYGQDESDSDSTAEG